MNNLEKKAEYFARKKHDSIGHTRKYTGQPYTTHLEEVVKIVKSVPHTVEMVCAAWLHDTVEDTGTSIDEIREEFGEKIASLVEMLTDVSKPEQGNRSVRKTIDREHTAKSSPEAKTIKLADLISNTSSIVKRDENFAKVYLKEKMALLEVLKEGDKKLWDVAHNLAVNGLKKWDYKK